MKTFTQFITEETLKHKVHDLPHGGKVYSQRINDHLVQTHFYPRIQNGEEGHYDVHFIRKTGDSGGDAFSRRGIAKMSVEERLRAIGSVKKAVKDFISTSQPKSLTAMGNTKKKADWSHEMLQRISDRHGGKVTRAGNEVSLQFNRRK